MKITNCDNIISALFNLAEQTILLRISNKDGIELASSGHSDNKVFSKGIKRGTSNFNKRRLVIWKKYAELTELTWKDGDSSLFIKQTTF